MPDPTVGISIVTFNSSRYLRPCLEAVFAQRGALLDIVVVDNASTDATAEMLGEFADQVRIVRNTRNAGFAEAQNQGIRTVRGNWVLTLNPDARMEPDFVRNLVAAGELDAVLDAGRARAAKEQGMFDRLRDGATTIELLDLDPGAVERS